MIDCVEWRPRPASFIGVQAGCVSIYLQAIFHHLRNTFSSSSSHYREHCSSSGGQPVNITFADQLINYYFQTDICFDYDHHQICSTHAINLYAFLFTKFAPPTPSTFAHIPVYSNIRVSRILCCRDNLFISYSRCFCLHHSCQLTNI